jgi:hypothetical protein
MACTCDKPATPPGRPHPSPSFRDAPLGAGPETITTKRGCCGRLGRHCRLATGIRGYGFRARAFARPGMTEAVIARSEATKQSTSPLVAPWTASRLAMTAGRIHPRHCGTRHFGTVTGNHNHETWLLRQAGAAWSSHHRHPCLWIPGSRCARPGMTARSRGAMPRLPQPAPTVLASAGRSAHRRPPSFRRARQREPGIHNHGCLW